MELIYKITLLNDLLETAIARLSNHPDHNYTIKKRINDKTFFVEITYNDKVIISESTQISSLDDAYQAFEFFMLKLIGGDLIYRSHNTNEGEIKSVMQKW